MKVSKAQQKRVLVAGGAGFLGSHLCEYLLGQGHAVLCIDNFISSAKSNLSHLLNLPHFELIEADVTLPLPQDLQVDEIYNLACPASPIQYQINPVGTTKTSIYGSINLLDLALRNKAKVLLASTSEVYGDPIEHPQQETYWGNVNPIGPRSCYDEGKRCAETLFFDYYRQYAVRIKLARIFNTYGPRMLPHDGRVMSNFIVQALSGKPITLFGDGSQTRSFCYVSDMIRGLVTLMETPDSITGPINLGNPNECTIRQIAEKVLKHTGASSPLEIRNLPSDDPRRRCPDISLAQQLLHWKPRIHLDEGLGYTIAYFREIMEKGQR